MDFIITLMGGSYHLWNPLIFSYFHPKFRKAVRDYIAEEVGIYYLKDQTRILVLYSGDWVFYIPYLLLP